MPRSVELNEMYIARNKLMKLIAIQEELESGQLDEIQLQYNLTLEQVDAYNANRLAEKQQLITELAAMMNAYLQQ